MTAYRDAHMLSYGDTHTHPNGVDTCLCICTHYHSDKHTEREGTDKQSERSGRGEKKDSEHVASRIIAVTKHERYL